MLILKGQKMKTLLKEFEYLTTKYGMDLIDSYLKGSFPHAIWSNGIKNIKIIFDFTDKNPIHVFVYDANDIVMFDYKEFSEELKYNPKSSKDIDGYIIYAAHIFYEILKEDKGMICI